VRVFIMTDMEGVAGVVNSDAYCGTDSPYYEVGRELTTRETNAAIEGALDAGATDILVVDGHGVRAINPLLLHPAARPLSRRPLSGPYPDALATAYDAVFFVGQHAKANTDGGHLAHSFSFGVKELSLNDRSIGELGLCLLAYASFGVPTVLVTGDVACGAEARDLVPEIETVAVKEGLRLGSTEDLSAEEARRFNGAAIHLHPERAREFIRAGATRALRRVREIPPLRIPPPYELVSVLRATDTEPVRVARVAGSDLVTVLRAPRDHVPVM
jgi:D-amino peptidase